MIRRCLSVFRMRASDEKMTSLECQFITSGNSPSMLSFAAPAPKSMRNGAFLGPMSLKASLFFQLCVVSVYA